MLPGIDDAIVWGSRVPRTLLAMVAGAGLAVAGAVLQTVVRNPLADSYVLGVTSGASLAAVAVTLAPAGSPGRCHGVSAAAFAGACSTLVSSSLGRRDGSLEPARLVAGRSCAVSYLLQGATSYLQLWAQPDQLSGVLFWLLGSVADAQWGDLRLPAALVAACTLWLLLHGRSLNALAMGEETAVLLGVPVQALRLQLLAVAAVLTAAVIAVAGGISFVGLIVPHCVRLLIGASTCPGDLRAARRPHRRPLAHAPHPRSPAHGHRLPHRLRPVPHRPRRRLGGLRRHHGRAARLLYQAHRQRRAQRTPHRSGSPPGPSSSDSPPAPSPTGGPAAAL
ncbi:Vitamin B12 import system permease protein BtuC [Streptomyces alboniger]